MINNVVVVSKLCALHIGLIQVHNNIIVDLALQCTHCVNHAFMIILAGNSIFLLIANLVQCNTRFHIQWRSQGGPSTARLTKRL